MTYNNGESELAGCFGAIASISILTAAGLLALVDSCTHEPTPRERIAQQLDASEEYNDWGTVWFYDDHFEFDLPDKGMRCISGYGDQLIIDIGKISCAETETPSE